MRNKYRLIKAPAVIMLILLQLLLLTTPAVAQPNGITVYVNGEIIPFECGPIVVDGCAMLPLRETFGIFGWDNIAWDNQCKMVTVICGDLVLEISMDDDFEGQTPVLRNSRVYLPISIISDTFDSYINYTGSKIFIVTPFLFKDGQWYSSPRSIANKSIGNWNPNEKKPVVVNNEEQKKTGDKIYFQLYVQGLTLVPSHLYALDDTGKSKYLLYMEHGTDCYKIYGDTLYYQFTSFMGYGMSFIIKADLAAEPIQKQTVGRPALGGGYGISYGCRLVLDKDDDNKYYVDQIIPSQWALTPEGIYAMGYDYSAAIEGIITDLPLLEKTYGWYLIDPDENTPTMVEKLPLEYKSGSVA